jgi:hypothetical protein
MNTVFTRGIQEKYSQEQSPSSLKPSLVYWQ